MPEPDGHPARRQADHDTTGASASPTASARPPATQLVEVPVAGHAGVQAEGLRDPRAGGVPQVAPPPWIAGEREDGGAQRGGVAWRHDATRDAVLHGLGVAADVADDHRDAGRHALEQAVGEAFLVGGQDADVAGDEERGDVVPEPEPPHPLREAQRVGAGPEHRPGAVVPAGAEENPVGRQLSGDPRQGVEQVGVPLVRDEVGRGRQDERRRRDTQASSDLARGGEAREGVQVDPVVDEPEAFPWHAFGGQFAHDCP